MTDEEEVLTAALEGNPHPRGSLNLKAGGLATNLIAPLVSFAVNFLDEPIGGAKGYDHIVGWSLSVNLFDKWRKTLDAHHHFELFRALREAQVFSSAMFDKYPKVTDNPYILLRLAKSLAHAAQWVESFLSLLQGAAASGKSLNEKLEGDAQLKRLRDAATAEGRSMTGHMLDAPADINAHLRAYFRTKEPARE